MVQDEKKDGDKDDKGGEKDKDDKKDDKKVSPPDPPPHSVKAALPMKHSNLDSKLIGRGKGRRQEG